MSGDIPASGSRTVPSLNAPVVVVIGGGPAGLMAAAAASASGARVRVFEAMPSAGRKFLIAGKGGLNLTHAEAFDRFLTRYQHDRDILEPYLREFDPEAIRAWAATLGIDTFVGSSGRVFPAGMKAAPLLRAWLRRLRADGVEFHMRHRWQGWDDSGALRFDTPVGAVTANADGVVLALGGASWPQLGADGAWVAPLQAHGIGIAPFKPANCGFETDWTPHLRERYAGQPVKSVVMSLASTVDGRGYRQAGEFIVTANGIEGGAVYALSAPLREQIAHAGEAIVHIDLTPGRELARLAEELARPRGRRTMASHLQRRAGIAGVKSGLLHEVLSAETWTDPQALAAAIKALPLRLTGTRPLAEAISTAGGVRFSALAPELMLTQLPGVFCAGEMLDWEAPTGGYLLTACLATGRAAGAAASAWAHRHNGRTSYVL